MYKMKDKEGRKKEKKKRRSWGSRRSSYRQGIQQSKQATVQIELPGKVCDLCQICNWARTVTLLLPETSRFLLLHSLVTLCLQFLSLQRFSEGVHY